MIRKIIHHWLPLAAVIAVVCGLTFLVGQQVLRLTGNDPQIQLAQDAAARLAGGEPLASVVPTGAVDVGHSLAPFTIAYDDQGKVLASTGLLHGQPPALPAGVFDYVRKNGEDRISWQPEPGARFAAVVERVSGAEPGFVVVARSLRETEQREGVVEQLAVAAGLAALTLSLLLMVFVEMVAGPRKNGE